MCENTASTRGLYERKVEEAMENAPQQASSDKTYYREEGRTLLPWWWEELWACQLTADAYWSCFGFSHWPRVDKSEIFSSLNVLLCFFFVHRGGHHLPNLQPGESCLSADLSAICIATDIKPFTVLLSLFQVRHEGHGDLWVHVSAFFHDSGIGLRVVP